MAERNASKRKTSRIVAWMVPLAAVLAVVALVTCWLVSRRQEPFGPLVIAYAHGEGQQSPAGTEWGRKVAEACGCEVEWRDVTPESEEGRLVADLNSYGQSSEGPQVGVLQTQPAVLRTKPDVFVSFGNITNHDRIEMTNGTKGYLDFRDHLKDMPNVSEYFRQVPQAKAIAQQGDGSIVSIPGDAGGDYDGSMVHMFVNRVWLDRLGLQVPTTWDELKAVLVAFRDRDPNGNGQADEIPFAIRPTVENSRGDQGAVQQTFSNDGWYLLLNSLGLATQLNEPAGWNQYTVSRGLLSNYRLSPQMRQVAAFLTDLAGEHLIDRESFAQALAAKQSNEEELVNMNQAGDGETPRESSVDTNVGTTFAEYEAQLAAAAPVAGVAFAFDASAFGPNAGQYESIPIPAAEAGMEVTWDYSARARFNLSGVSVRGDTEHVDQAVRAVDALFGEDVSLGQYYGEEGVTISRESEHAKVVVSGDGEYSKGYGRSFVGWIRPGTIIENDKPRERYLAAEKSYQPIWQRMDGDGIIPAGMYSETEVGTGIGNETDWYLADWVSAAWDGRPLDDASWNDYAAWLESNGMVDNDRQQLAQWQRLYDRYAKRYGSD